MTASRPVGVTARGWGWRHGGRRAWAIDGLDLTIEPGERVLLLGPSGSGKSTVLAAIAGVLGEDAGEQRGALEVDGVPPQQARGRAGLLLQDPESQVILPRVGDDVAFGCENAGVPRDEIWVRVRAALRTVALDVPLGTPTNTLSGGQKQRLALAGVLAMRPGLLLLDEPTAELDPDGADRVRAAVIRATEHGDATLVVVEHRVAPWVDLVDRVVVLGTAGVIAADGPPRAVLQQQGAALAAQGVWVPGHEPHLNGASASTSTTLLEARQLAAGRDGAVVTRIDTTVQSGRLTALSGPNGAGKTTVALTLGGLLPPVDGRLAATADLAAGLAAAPVRWRSRDLLTRIGSVFQSPQHQFLRPTVREELAVGLRRMKVGDREREARIDLLLAALALVPLAEANPFTLSGGQQRRLSVGAALATAPRVLVLDEPTFGQDALTWRSLTELMLTAVADGVAVVVSTHDDLLLELAHDRIRLGPVSKAAA